MQAILDAIDNRGRLASFYNDDQPRVPAGNSDGGQWAAQTGSTHEQPWAAPVRNYLARTTPPTPAETSALANHLHSLTTEQLRGLRADHGVAAPASSKSVLVAKLREKFTEARAKQTAAAPTHDAQAKTSASVPMPAPWSARPTAPAKSEAAPPALHGTEKQIAFAESVRQRVLRDAEKYVRAREHTGHPDAARDREALGQLKQEASARYWIDARNESIGEHLQSMRNVHAPFSVEEDDGRGRLAAVFAEDDGGGRWVTIGADDSDHGGTPVYIKDGVITKGPADLANRKIGDLKSPPEIERPKEPGPDASKAEQKAYKDKLAGVHRAELNQSKESARKEWGKQAKAIGHKPEHLHKLAGEMMAHDKAGVEEKTAALKSARRTIESYGGDWKTASLQAARGGDATKTKGIDVAAEILKRQHPEMFGDDSEHPTDRLFEMLAAGNPKAMSEDQAYQQAFDELSRQAPEKVSRARGDAYEGRSGRKAKASAAVDDVPFSDDGRGRLAAFYDEDEARDEKGKWTVGGGSGLRDANEASNDANHLSFLAQRSNKKNLAAAHSAAQKAHEETAGRFKAVAVHALDDRYGLPVDHPDNGGGVGLRDAQGTRMYAEKMAAIHEDKANYHAGQNRNVAPKETEAPQPAAKSKGPTPQVDWSSVSSATSYAESHVSTSKPLQIVKGESFDGHISISGNKKYPGYMVKYFDHETGNQLPGGAKIYPDLQKAVTQARATAGESPAEKPKPIANPFDSFKRAPAPQGQLFEPRATDVKPDPNARDKSLRDLSAVQKRSPDWDMPQLDRKYGGATILHLPSGHSIETTAMGDEYMVKDAAGKKVAQFKEAKDAADYIEKRVGKSEPASSSLAPVTQTMRGKLFDFSADFADDNRGRLVAAFDADGDTDAPDGDNDADDNPPPMPLGLFYPTLQYLPRHKQLSLLHDAAERSHPDHKRHHHAAFAADDGRGRLAAFYSEDQLRDNRGRWTAGAGDDAAREHSIRQIRAFAAKSEPATREELEQLGGHLSRLTVKQLRQVRDEHGLKGSGPDKEQFVAKLGEKFVAHRVGNALSPAEQREYDASKKATVALRTHGAESPEAKAAGEEHKAAWEALRQSEAEAPKSVPMPTAAQITQENKEIASTPIDDRGRIADNKPVESKPQPQETKMDAAKLESRLWALAGEVSRESMVDLPTGSINTTNYGPHTPFSAHYRQLVDEALKLADDIPGEDGDKIRLLASKGYSPMHNNDLAAAIAQAANGLGAKARTRESKL
jgi:hypothetical protein